MLIEFILQVDDKDNPRFAKLVDFGFARMLDEYPFFMFCYISKLSLTKHTFSMMRGPPLTICGTGKFVLIGL